MYTNGKWNDNYIDGRTTVPYSLIEYEPSEQIKNPNADNPSGTTTGQPIVAAQPSDKSQLYWGFDKDLEGWERTGSVPPWHTMESAIQWYDHWGGAQGVIVIDACESTPSGYQEVHAKGGIKKSVTLPQDAENIIFNVVRVNHDGGIKFLISDSEGQHTLGEEVLSGTITKQLSYDISAWGGKAVTLEVQSFGAGTDDSGCVGSSHGCGSCCGEYTGIDWVKITSGEIEKPPKQAKVLLDYAHYKGGKGGQISELNVRNQGFLVDNLSVFPVDQLDNYDVILIDTPTKPYTSMEIQKIVAFIQNGGGLLIANDWAFGSGAVTSITNQILENIGISAIETNAGDGTFGKNNNKLKEHEITRDINAVYAGAVSRLDVPKSADILIQSDSSIIAAAIAYGAGRVVILGDNDLVDSNYGYDNAKFLKNILKWLSISKSPTPVQPTKVKWDKNGNYYEVMKKRLNWSDAKSYAENQQFTDPNTGLVYKGHLATITSPEENSWIVQNLISPISATYICTWLGGYQDEGSAAGNPSKGWNWITGEPWSWTNWNPGEPNDASGGESFLEMFTWEDNNCPDCAKMGKWNDDKVNGGKLNTNYILIEYEPSVIMKPNHPPELSVPGVTPEKPLMLYSGNLEYSVIYEDKDGDRPKEIRVNIGAISSTEKNFDMNLAEVYNDVGSYKALYKVSVSASEYGQWLSPEINHFYIYCSDGKDSTQTPVIDGPVAQGSGTAKVKFTVVNVEDDALDIGNERVPCKILNVKPELVDGIPGSDNWYKACAPENFDIIAVEKDIPQEYIKEYSGPSMERYLPPSPGSQKYSYKLELDRPFLIFEGQAGTEEHDKRAVAFVLLLTEFVGLPEKGKEIADWMGMSVFQTSIMDIAEGNDMSKDSWRYLPFLENSIDALGIKATKVYVPLIPGKLSVDLNYDGKSPKWAAPSRPLTATSQIGTPTTITAKPGDTLKLLIRYDESNSGDYYSMRAFTSWDKHECLLDLGKLDTSSGHPYSRDFLGRESGDRTIATADYALPKDLQSGDYFIRVVYMAHHPFYRGGLPLEGASFDYKEGDNIEADDYYISVSQSPSVPAKP